eukprot:1799420-Alexandrium_andersonii.AAC.1
MARAGLGDEGLRQLLAYASTGRLLGAQPKGPGVAPGTPAAAPPPPVAPATPVAGVEAIAGGGVAGPRAPTGDPHLD